jgi:hypothetical protein
MSYMQRERIYNGEKRMSLQSKLDKLKKRYPNWIKINPENCAKCIYAANPKYTDAKLRCICKHPITIDDFDIYKDDILECKIDLEADYEEDSIIEETIFRRYINWGDGWLCFSYIPKRI